MENGVAITFRLMMFWMAANAAVVAYLAVFYSVGRLLLRCAARAGVGESRVEKSLNLGAERARFLRIP